jgi:hypothetical protein
MHYHVEEYSSNHASSRTRAIFGSLIEADRYVEAYVAEMDDNVIPLSDRPHGYRITNEHNADLGRIGVESCDDEGGCLVADLTYLDKEDEDEVAGDEDDEGEGAEEGDDLHLLDTQAKGRSRLSSDSRKLATMMYLQEERDFDASVAGRVVLAMMPLDDGYRPSRGFEKAARKLAKQFSKALKRADEEESDRLATETLRAITALAVEHGEDYYATRYETALST